MLFTYRLSCFHTILYYNRRTGLKNNSVTYHPVSALEVFQRDALYKSTFYLQTYLGLPVHLPARIGGSGWVSR